MEPCIERSAEPLVRGKFCGCSRCSIQKHWEQCTQIGMPLGLTRVGEGLREYVLDGVKVGRIHLRCEV